MPGPKRIKGNPGTDPAAPPPATQEPPPETERVGSVIEEGGRVYVRSGALKILLDESSIRRLRRADSPTARPGWRETKISEELSPAIAAARKYSHALRQKPGVLGVRAGYKFVDGEITPVPCVVVAVDQKRADVTGDARIPTALDGVPTDVSVADAYERLAAASRTEAAPIVPRPRLLIDEIQSNVNETELLEALPVITYEPPPNGNLEPVTGAMTVTCHVSPDAGWKVLKPFLAATQQKMRLGMYDFTAPHIYAAIRSVLRDSDVSWQQTLGASESLPGEDDVDSTKAGDLAEAKIVRGLERVAGDRFRTAFARTGAGRTFASAYHIKVAVRDGSSLWLSSGNWQSSNQPDIDFLDSDADRQVIPRYNREWHVIVENPKLAERLERFLEFDYETASTAPEAAELPAAALPELLLPVEDLLEEERSAADLEVFPPRKFAFTESKPLTIQPILSPDNYVDVVLDLLQTRPKRALYFQNQSLNPIRQPSEEFAKLLDLLAEYSHDEGLDVRIIFRNIGPIRKKLESLQAAGFNMKRVRVQAGCHTKGLIIDSETVLIGSHNFTNQGVQANRDASLLIRQQPSIAKYYERVFLHDWERLARSTIHEEATWQPIRPDEAATLDLSCELARLPWGAYEDE